VTRADRGLWLLYAAAAGLTARCAAVSARHGAWWYAAGLAVTALLLVVAVGREYVAADERRAAAIRAERAARLRAARALAPGMRRLADAIALDTACCELWWTSCGTDHNPDTYIRKDQHR
jgi:hypothetical protein